MRSTIPKRPQLERDMQIVYKEYNRISCTSVAVFICLLTTIGISKTNAVPTDSAVGDAVVDSLLHRRVLREIATITAAASLVHDETKDATSTEVMLDHPQGQCLLDGVLVAETTVFCEKQVGCRAIQKTGHCCPDYKCDCHKDGKTYLNGDKLVDPETPCTVCYCQGGEILCSSVTCFHRDDCTPKYVAGRCCPEYDNCPVSSAEHGTIENGTFLTSTNLTTAQPDVPAVEMPKITIKEITKPTEIRITDPNKAIPIHQMLKPSTTETPTTSTTTTTTAALVVTTTRGLEINNESSMQTQLSADNNHNASPPPSVGINNETLKLSASVAYSSTHPPISMAGIREEGGLEAADDTVAQSKFEQADADKPIAVEVEYTNASGKVNIKREFMFATTEGPLSSSSLATEPLDAAELIHANADVSANVPSGSLQQALAELEPDTAGSDNIYHIILTTDGPKQSGSTALLLTPKAIGSTEVLNASSTSDTLIELSNNNNNNNGKASVETLSLPSTTDAPAQLPTSTYTNVFASSEPTSTTESTETDATSSSKSTTEAIESSSIYPSKSSTMVHHHVDDEDAVAPAEANPAYPSLPEDDFSLRDVNFPLSEIDDTDGSHVHHQPTYDALKSTKQLDESGLGNMDGSGSGSGALLDMDGSSTTADTSGLSSTTLLPPRVLAKVELMYSKEYSSEELAIANSSDLLLEKIMKEAENETGSGDSLETVPLGDSMDSGSGSGNGSDELVDLASVNKKEKQREPTTPKPSRKPLEELDIDEQVASGDGKAAPADDPKLDVESLKLDETPAENAVKTDEANKGELAVQVKAAEEATDGSASSAAAGSDVRVQRLYLQRIF